MQRTPMYRYRRQACKRTNQDAEPDRGPPTQEITTKKGKRPRELQRFGYESLMEEKQGLTGTKPGLNWVWTRVKPGLDQGLMRTKLQQC